MDSCTESERTEESDHLPCPNDCLLTFYDYLISNTYVMDLLTVCTKSLWISKNPPIVISIMDIPYVSNIWL